MNMEAPAPALKTNRQILREIYPKITSLAKPGDLAFVISPKRYDEPYPFSRRIYRRLEGLIDADESIWHTAIYTGAPKNPRGSGYEPRIIHGTQRGVVEDPITVNHFSGTLNEEGEAMRSPRLEILQNPDLTDDQRRAIVEFCRGELGKPYYFGGWKDEYPTYLFGLPSRKKDPKFTSCIGLVFEAYQQAGITFPHQLPFLPRLLLGYPIGHPKDHVDPERLYLRDHHLYRDPRFEVILTVSKDQPDSEPIVHHNPPPGKYSWNPHLQRAYGFA